METIKTQDVYLKVEGKSALSKNVFQLVDGAVYTKMMVEKHSNMVVLTKGEACAKIIDAMVVAYRMGICNESGDSFKTKCGEYLTQLFNS
jgi:hypothetical protein